MQQIQAGGICKQLPLFISRQSFRPGLQRFFHKLRDELAKRYDEADVAHLAVSRAGVGFATLTCERGFQGLRWVLSARHREGGYTARLIDRTDGDPVTVEQLATAAGRTRVSD